MRGAVSLELGLLAIVLVVMVSLMASEVYRAIQLGKTADRVVYGKPYAVKLLSAIQYLEKAEEGSQLWLAVYLPKRSLLYVENGQLVLMVGNLKALQASVPVVNDINLMGEGWYPLTLKRVSGGVEIS